MDIKYRGGINMRYITYDEFYDKILNELDPYQVFKELGENSVLLCYEKPGQFCHRHLVAKWLMDNLNIKILEL